MDLLNLKKQRIYMNCKTREEKTLQARIERFITLGKEKHGEDAYDYSLAQTQYIRNRTPVELICKRCVGSKPFWVYPFAHTDKGDNEKGTCTNCYVPKQTISDTRWKPNLMQRISEFKETVEKKYGKNYSYPHLEEEYKNEESEITVKCTTCDAKPCKLLARSLKSRSRKGGCKNCTKIEMAKTIAEKNSARLLRNHQTKDMPRPYGCIYKISNLKNSKFYIGYTTMSAKKRFKAHIDEAIKASKGNKKAKSYLHSAMNYHGHENFTVEILEAFKNIAPTTLGTIEMQYIAKMKPHYNVSPGGELGHYKTDFHKAY
jgi:hypothetical protein